MNDKKRTDALEKRRADLSRPVANGEALSTLVLDTKQSLIRVSGGKLTNERIDRLAMLARMAAAKVPQLLGCTQASFILAFMDAARTGLDWDGEHAAIVPFKDTATFMPMYKGILYLMVSSGAVLDARAVPVFKGEPYRFIDGATPIVEHDASSFEIDRSDDSFRGAWFVATMPNGGKRITRGMSRQEIEKRRDVSKTKDRGDSPWKLWFVEQALKTVLKHESKQIPRTYHPDAIRLVDALEVDNRIERGERSLSAEVVSDLPPSMQPPSPTNRGMSALKEQLGVGNEDPPPEMSDADREEMARVEAERIAAGGA